MIAFVFLGAALLLFLLSTRQFAIVARIFIWLGAVALLAIATAVVSADDAHYGLLRMSLDALRHGRHSVLAESLQNWPAVSGVLPPMFDIFLALAVLLGLVALIAFTPGDRLDRVVRSLLVCLIGAIVGGLLALVISASGLGGYPKDRVYAGLPEADDVIDGDTIRMGDVSLRLNGIDAPEFHDAADNTPSSHNQFCRNGDQLLPCGAEARLYLLSLVMKGPVICGPPTSSAFSAGAPREHQLRESFGRPIVQCNVHTEDGETIDLSERMVKDGYAVEFSDRDSPPAASDDFTVGCGIRPYSWRNNTALREAFLRPGPFTAPATELIGDCTGIAVSPP